MSDTSTYFRPAANSRNRVYTEARTATAISPEVPRSRSPSRPAATLIANRAGSENTPAPTMEPTTIEVSVQKASFGASTAFAV